MLGAPETPVGRKAKMKRLALIGLVMVLGASGCVFFNRSSSIGETWAEYWKNPDGESSKSIKQDWDEYWKNPGGDSWESIKQYWAEYWKNLGGDSSESIEQYWKEFWN